MAVHPRARAVCTWQFDRVSPQISTNTATNCSRLAIKNSRTSFIQKIKNKNSRTHLRCRQLRRIPTNKSRNRDRRQRRKQERGRRFTDTSLPFRGPASEPGHGCRPHRLFSSQILVACACVCVERGWTTSAPEQGTLPFSTRHSARNPSCPEPSPYSATRGRKATERISTRSSPRSILCCSSLKRGAGDRLRLHPPEFHGIEVWCKA